MKPIKQTIYLPTKVDTGYDRWILNRVYYKTKELLKLWKEQRIKTLYYE